MKCKNLTEPDGQTESRRTMRNGGDKKVSQCFFVKRIVDSDARREYIGSVALGRVF